MPLGTTTAAGQAEIIHKKKPRKGKQSPQLATLNCAGGTQRCKLVEILTPAVQSQRRVRCMALFHCWRYKWDRRNGTIKEITAFEV